MQVAGDALRRLIEKVDAGIAVSEPARDVVVRHLGRDAVVIPNGFDHASFLAVAEPAAAGVLAGRRPAADSPSSAGWTSRARDCRCCWPPCRPSGRRSATSRSASPATAPAPGRTAGCRAAGCSAGVDERAKRDLLARHRRLRRPAGRPGELRHRRARGAGRRAPRWSPRTCRPSSTCSDRRDGRPAGSSVPAWRCRPTSLPPSPPCCGDGVRRQPLAGRSHDSGTTGRGSPRPSPQVYAAVAPAPQGRRSSTSTTGSAVPGPRWTTLDPSGSAGDRGGRTPMPATRARCGCTRPPWPRWRPRSTAYRSRIENGRRAI